MGPASPQRTGRSFSGQTLRHVLGGMALLSLAVMLSGAIAGGARWVTAGAAAFAMTAASVAGVTLAQAWRWREVSSNAPGLTAYVALLQTTWLAAICYGWGAAAMQGLYLTPLTGLRWQHGWQYAAAMALLAAANYVFASSIPRPNDPTASQSARAFRWAVPLAASQALVAAVGLAALAVSGKLASERADWAANRVFVGLAVAVLAVSLVALVLQRRLRPSGRS